MKEALLWESIENGAVVCGLCHHRCRINKGNTGVCSVRKNENGSLYTYAYGRVIAEQADPIEKKPLYHFLPQSYSFSVAAAGCNFKCGFCQNWSISQVSELRKNRDWGKKATPEQIVESALELGCKSISFTYTEPAIFFEYCLDTAKTAKQKGLKTIFVSNGYMTPEALRMIRPFLDACNIDLKSFRNDYYRKLCGASLKPVLESLRLIRELGIWLEVTTLIITDENDSGEELRDIAAFIANDLGKDVPWHVSRFFPQYKFAGRTASETASVEKAVRIGREAGLSFVYAGNVDLAHDTVCPVCHKTVMARRGYRTDILGLESGRCKSCGAGISGVFG
ncbi:MAG: AmmeMemoRadiSam system radical SAM enzyme [Chitinispirillales bacterium]|jgi:pyruvate formate lyase activating enzyme|nr:AmmeMemoRadiSam system radical SAM enzyme [Chitinispirillales bacterium]